MTRFPAVNRSPLSSVRNLPRVGVRRDLGGVVGKYARGVYQTEGSVTSWVKFKNPRTRKPKAALSCSSSAARLRGDRERRSLYLPSRSGRRRGHGNVLARQSNHHSRLALRVGGPG